MANEETLSNKVILVTGGSGSLGQSVIKEALKSKPKAIRVFSNDEFAQVEMEQHFNNSIIRYLIGDIRDKDRLHRAMNGVNLVIHCAALKHVPVCEYNPIEAVKININGSINVIDTAIDNKVDKVLAISSDKAVHPINIYGATKLAMEKLIIQSNVYGNTKFSCIRYGNFSVSRGNVLDRWEQELEKGDALTITEKEMTRFWISLEEAARFTIDCLSRMVGGEIFIPKMPQKSVEELVNQIAPQAKLNIIGKRGSEKLTELLFAEGELPQDQGDYFVVR